MSRFIMKLCAHLGRTRQELLTGRPGLGPDELSWWLAWDKIEPIGQPWLQSAHLMSLLANLLSSGRRRWDFQDFLPIPRRRPEQSFAEQVALLDGFKARWRPTAELPLPPVAFPSVLPFDPPAAG